MLTEYINREAVMQMFADRVKRSNNSDFAPTPTWSQAVQIVEDFPAADVVERPRWISVKERLPEDGVEVVCWLCTDAGDCYASAGWYDTTFKMWDLDSEYALSRHVTHWMPLPQPPED